MLDFNRQWLYCKRNMQNKWKKWNKRALPLILFSKLFYFMVTWLQVMAVTWLTCSVGHSDLYLLSIICTYKSFITESPKQWEGKVITVGDLTNKQTNKKINKQIYKNTPKIVSCTYIVKYQCSMLVTGRQEGEFLQGGAHQLWRVRPPFPHHRGGGRGQTGRLLRCPLPPQRGEYPQVNVL